MKANETHISLETAKLLKDYKVNSKYIFCSIGVKSGCNTLENQIYGYKRRIKNNFGWNARKHGWRWCKK